jgi:SlyX protein
MIPGEKWEKDMEKRMTQLETRLSFQERLLQELNSVVIGQQKRIDLLELKLAALKDQNARGDLVKELDEEERPPHY